MQYEFHILDVKDADALVINYKDSDNDSWHTAVIDAGNVGDGKKIKPFIKHTNLNSQIIIDYAFCTHPDRDHKGGFFDLFDDNWVRIENFCILSPDVAVCNDPRIKTVDNQTELIAAAKAVYNHPTDKTRNLLDEITTNSNYYAWNYGEDIPGMPLMIIGPHYDYFTDTAFDMASDFAELKDEERPDTYAEDDLPSEDNARSVMDETKEESATNKSSMIILFHPQGRKFLLAGDACSASIKQALIDYPEIKGCTLKVPHHGSKHNLTTELIKNLNPSQSVISCKGSKKHPNPAIVHYLSKYGKVFATSKSGVLTYYSVKAEHPATPLRDKHD